jgi:hypothetical protein
MDPAVAFHIDTRALAFHCLVDQSASSRYDAQPQTVILHKDDLCSVPLLAEAPAIVD